MKLKTLLISLLTTVAVSSQAQTTKLLGGDLSLVPAYEAAGDVWLDADGNNIKTTYTDGMLGFVKEKAKWNSVRVRLLVDPTQDSYVATCQDIEYVKKLGKRIKDAGMNLLLDIFYSDTWADVSQQWIPTSWNMNRNTATETIAAKVKSYTTEAINALTAYGAKPDYVQVGNEVSYGMLWDSASGANKSNWFITSSTYDAQQTNINRFATLLKAAAEGVKASSASTAKIVLHCERVGDGASAVNNFYTWVEQAGFTDYDVIGLSFYPQWHGTVAKLKGVITNLTTSFPNKKIQIVETGYKNDGSETDYTPAGQATFLTDLISMLNECANVDGLYYWQPEECAMMAFIGETPDEEEQGTEVTDFENLDFENGESNIVWTLVYTGWGDGPWPKTGERSSMVTGYAAQAWTSSASNLSVGNIIYQSKDNMPAGTYTVKAVVHSDYDGIYLFANDDKTLVSAYSDWKTAEEVSVQTTLNEPGTLTIGLTLPTKPTSTSKVNLYADNFKVTRVDTGVDNIIMDEAKTKDKPIKVLRNGMVLIEKNGRTYNAQGQIVK